MENTIEKKVIENWKTDKKIFDNLKVGDKISEESAVYHTQEKYFDKGKIVVSCHRDKGIDCIVSFVVYWDSKLNQAKPYQPSINHQFRSTAEAYKNQNEILIGAKL